VDGGLRESSDLLEPDDEAPAGWRHAWAAISAAINRTAS
jgi:hypothetical protein